MSPLSSSVISVLSTATLIGQIVAGVLLLIVLANYFFPKVNNLKKITNLVSNNYIPIILVLSAIATMGSLTLSEVLNFTPCKLCWFQRIAMYPILLLSLIALISNDTKIKKYILSLSVIGFVIAVYHVLVQLFPTFLECSDEVAKCSAKDFAQYGYITIPVMSLTAFALIILVSLVGLKKKK